MTIEIPLSKELLTWWIEHLRYIPEDMRLAAPLPVLLRASGDEIDLGAAGLQMVYDIESEAVRVDGHVGVSSSDPDAQPRLFGLEYMRDGATFSLTPEEQKLVSLMCYAAVNIAERATGDDMVAFGKLLGKAGA